MKSQRITVEVPDGVIKGWCFSSISARHASEAAPLRMFFIHATGFCASVYRQMFENMDIGDRSDSDQEKSLRNGYGGQGMEIFAMDMRGHGQTELPDNPDQLKSWDVYVEDVHHCLDQFNIRDANNKAPWVLGGHSMGAVAALMAGARRDDVRAIAMIEPVALPELLSVIAAMPFWPIMSRRFPMAMNAARRRNHWPDRQTVKSSYEKKSLFKSWREGVLDDYLKDGLIDRQAGVGLCDVRLACDPEWEAATFRAQANPFWRNVRTLSSTKRSNLANAAGRCSAVSILAGRLEGSTVSARAQSAFQKSGFGIERDEAFTHLLPMESPARAAAFLLQAMVQD